MKVTMLARTGLIAIPEDYVDYMELSDWPTDADELAEIAGRLCYKSWNRPNPDTATSAGYLGNIIDHKHFSVLEHASVTFLIEDVSRSLTHELVRHRHFSFSQVSQRYVDESDAELIYPIAVYDDDVISGMMVDVMDEARQGYEMIYDRLIQRGYTTKEARGAARSVLPNMTSTDIIVTGNHRAWREFLDKRNSPHADAEIRTLAQVILAELKLIAPNTYADMES